MTAHARMDLTQTRGKTDALLRTERAKNGGKSGERCGGSLRTTCRSRTSAGAPADVKKARALSGLWKMVADG